jgi:hypothetical protein
VLYGVRPIPENKYPEIIIATGIGWWLPINLLGYYISFSSLAHNSGCWISYISKTAYQRAF